MKKFKKISIDDYLFIIYDAKKKNPVRTALFVFSLQFLRNDELSPLHSYWQNVYWNYMNDKDMSKLFNLIQEKENKISDFKCWVKYSDDWMNWRNENLKKYGDPIPLEKLDDIEKEEIKLFTEYV
jgi:hypothetical protein